MLNLSKKEDKSFDKFNIARHGRYSNPSKPPLNWVKKENLSKDRSYYNIKSDLKSDKKQYGGASCDHWNVGIVLGVEFCTPV